MIANCMTLVRVQFLSLFGINRVLHSRDKKEKRKLIFICIGIVLLALLFLSYSALTAIGFVMFGMTNAIPALMLTIAACITLVTTILKANGSLFGLRDYDIVMAMPVTSAVVITSRMLFLYLTAFLFGLLILLPCSIVFGMASAAPFRVWIMLFLSLFLAPLLPLIIGASLGALITAISVRFRHKNLVSTLLGMLFVSAILVGSMSLQTESQADLAVLGEQLLSMLNKLYPLCNMFRQALVDGNLLSFLWFVLLSIGSFCLFLLLLSRCYIKLNTAITSHSVKSDYQLGALKTSSSLLALYKKELMRYGSSSAYVMNTAIGMVLLILFGAGLFFTGTAQMEELFAMPGMATWLYSIAPFIPALMVAMSSTTCSSISLEGKNRWILYSMPVEAITVFDAKILVNLTVLLPGIVIGCGFLYAALTPSAVETLLLFAVPCAYALFVSVAGIWVNLKHPNYDFNSDIQVVKQGVPVLLMMLIGCAASLIPIAAIIVFGRYINPSLIAGFFGLLAAGAAFFLHTGLKKVRLSYT